MRMYPPALAAILHHPFVRRKDKPTPTPPSLEQKDDVEIAASAPDYCQH